METKSNSMKRSLFSIVLFILSTGITYLYFVWYLIPAVVKVILTQKVKINFEHGVLLSVMLMVAYALIGLIVSYLIRIFKPVKSFDELGFIGVHICGLIMSIFFSLLLDIVYLLFHLSDNSLAGCGLGFICILTYSLAMFLLFSFIVGLRNEFRKTPELPL